MDGPDLPIAECVIAQVVVCHSNDLAHALGFGPQLWPAQQGSQNERDFTGSRIGQDKAHDAISLVCRHFPPKVALVDGHKSRLGLPARQHRNSLVFDDGVWTQVGDKLDSATIPLSNVALQTTSQQLFIQDDHPTGSKAGSVFRNCSVTSRTASIMAARETRPRYPSTMSSMCSPAANRSSVPVISMRVYLKVGRPPHTPTARTT